MGERVEASALVVGHDHEVQRRLGRSVAALRRRVDGGWFIGHEDTVGMEVEFDLVDPLGRPRLINDAVLARLGRADMQHELGKFNVELNVAARRLQGRVLDDSERELTDVLDACRARIEGLGARLIAIGMLPTVSADQLTAERIAANPRYLLLCRRMRAARHRPFSVRIVGEGMAAAAAIYGYFADFLAERRREPREDLMSALVGAEIYGTRLTDDELLGFCLLLLIAGHETTTNLLGNAAVVLAEHPRSRRRLVADPALLGPAVEELLRYDSPVQGLSRILTCDVTLHGTTMSRGESVLLLFGSANRDERVFGNPDVFDIDREPEYQVAFGRGVHFCLGAALARMEARIALQAFMARVPDWEVDVDSAARLHSGPIRGYLSLPITWPTKQCGTDLR